MYPPEDTQNPHYNRDIIGILSGFTLIGCIEIWIRIYYFYMKKWAH